MQPIVPPHRHSANSPSSAQPPKSTEPAEPVNDADEAIDIYQKDDRFDDRPEDPVKPRSLLGRWRDWMASAFENASLRVMQALRLTKVPSIREGVDFDAIQVSAPFNVKKTERKDFPQEVRDGLDAFEAEQSAAASKQAFIQGADMVPQVTRVPSADEQAFGHYMSAWRQQRHQPGRVTCPQNFEAGARRVASDVLDLERQRRETMAKEGKDYWLAPDDKDRVDAAAALLQSDDDAAARAQAKAVIDAGPVQPLTIDQALVFHAWREWKKNPDKLPSREGFSLDAALAYAHLQVQTHASASHLIENYELRDLLADATELIAHHDQYGVRLEEAWLLESLADLRDFDKQQASKHDADEAPATAQAAAEPPRPSPPPPRPARREQSPASTATLSFAERMGLPPLGSLAPEDRMTAEETFSKFVDAFRRDMAGFVPDEKTDFLDARCVAVADDYAEKIIAAQDAKLSDAQRDRLLAALRLRELYAQRRR